MQLRRDYVLDRWVIISEKRGKRPREFRKQTSTNEFEHCYFCPGNEHETPPEISRMEKDDKWYIRVFPNKFPAVIPDGDPEIRTDNDFYTYSTAYGSHEVVVETPNHNEQLGDLSVNRIAEIFKVYRERINELSKDSKYVIVFKNHGADAGTSLIHSHTQIASINVLPEEVAAEVNACKCSCPYCLIIEREGDSDRSCLENDSFIAFTPYASRFNYELWIFPKEHLRTLNDFDEKHFFDLAEVMKNVLMKLKRLGASYNFFIHYAPAKEDLHFHIEILPRIATWGGFEFCSGIIINSVSPETAAEYYRG